RPLTPVITWADTRSAPDALALRRRLDQRALHARTGAPLHPAFFPAKLRWLARTHPEVRARAVTWCGFGEHLLAVLTGTLRSSLSMASGTGLLDQSRGAWDAGALEAAGIAPDTLPPIDDTPLRGLRGRWAARWPALAQVPWLPARGDGACSNVGSDCWGPDRVALNVGTSAALRVVLPAAAASATATPWGLWRHRGGGARRARADRAAVPRGRAQPRLAPRRARRRGRTHARHGRPPDRAGLPGRGGVPPGRDLRPPAAPGRGRSPGGGLGGRARPLPDVGPDHHRRPGRAD